jgi:2-oxo-4-hydroxy-4-carboxy-5-ureidoimidazoline decarboxylase
MTIAQLNALPEDEVLQLLISFCGSSVWAKEMLMKRPFASTDTLMEAAEACWSTRSEADFLEAFSHHPKIGDISSLREKFASTAHFASGEQGSVASASEEILQGLARGNADYEQKFGFIFIVCATGKSASEMLELLENRLPNSREEELRIAAGEQSKITRIRLEKLLS